MYFESQRKTRKICKRGHGVPINSPPKIQGQTYGRGVGDCEGVWVGGRDGDIVGSGEGIEVGREVLFWGKQTGNVDEEGGGFVS